jgi:hypothetical protein
MGLISGVDGMANRKDLSFLQSNHGLSIRSSDFAHSVITDRHDVKIILG